MSDATTYSLCPKCGERVKLTKWANYCEKCETLIIYKGTRAYSKDVPLRIYSTASAETIREILKSQQPKN